MLAIVSVVALSFAGGVVATEPNVCNAFENLGVPQLDSEEAARTDYLHNHYVTWDSGPDFTLNGKKGSLKTLLKKVKTKVRDQFIEADCDEQNSKNDDNCTRRKVELKELDSILIPAVKGFIDVEEDTIGHTCLIGEDDLHYQDFKIKEFSLKVNRFAQFTNQFGKQWVVAKTATSVLVPATKTTDVFEDPGEPGNFDDNPNNFGGVEEDLPNHYLCWKPENTDFSVKGIDDGEAGAGDGFNYCPIIRVALNDQIINDPPAPADEDLEDPDTTPAVNDTGNHSYLVKKISRVCNPVELDVYVQKSTYGGPQGGSFDIDQNFAHLVCFEIEEETPPLLDPLVKTESQLLGTDEIKVAVKKIKEVCVPSVKHHVVKEDCRFLGGCPFRDDKRDDLSSETYLQCVIDQCLDG